MKNILTAILVVVSLMMLNVRPVAGQETAKPKSEEIPAREPAQGTQGASSSQRQTQPLPLDDKARKIKRMVEKIGVAGRLTLYLKNGENLYGSVVRYDEESLQVAEIDLKQVITVQYRNIKKIREDYGKRDPITGQRSNPPKGIKLGISIGLLFVAVGLPIVVLASMKD
ncbi:MAG TPA: hypothetical protein VF543_04980 [Pyrinomonadaceae bacterium]